MIPHGKLISLVSQKNSDFSTFHNILKISVQGLGLYILQNDQEKERSVVPCSNHVGPLTFLWMPQSLLGQNIFLNTMYSWLEISFCKTALPPLQPTVKHP